MSPRQSRDPQDEDARGFDFHDKDVAPSAGSYSELPPADNSNPTMGDDVYSQGGSKSDDLAQMYVKREAGASGGAGRLTIRDGVHLQKEQKNTGPLVTVVFLLLVVGGIVAALFLVKMDLVNIEGEREKLSLIDYIKAQANMGDYQRELNNLDADQLGMVITLDRIDIVYNSAVAYYSSTGVRSTNLEEIKKESKVEAKVFKDGWGRAFAVEEIENELLVRSSGVDGFMRTPDDFVVDNKGKRYPSEVDELTFLKGTGAGSK